MNFLHITTFYPPYSFGGDAIQVYRLCHALADLGHRVDVVHDLDAYRMFHPGEPETAFAEHPGVVRHALGGGKWVSPLWTHQTGRLGLKRARLREILDARDYDVIHFHNISLVGVEALSLRPARGKPVKLYTAHEHWLICPLSVLWKMDRAPCDKPECVRCTLQAGRPPQFWRYTDYLGRMAANVDCFLSPSRFTAKMHAERGFPQPFTHLPNFVDGDEGEWRNLGARPQERPYFLFVGRLERIKGAQDLISVWDRVRGCDLLLAGTGTYEAELRRLAAGNSRIRFLGPVAHRDLGALYFHALACVTPSLTYETFGMTSVEAFARKTPAVVRNLGGLPELIEDSGGGYVFSGDEELLAALARIAESPGLRGELGERGYEAYRRLWSRERHLERYFEIVNATAKD